MPLKGNTAQDKLNIQKAKARAKKLKDKAKARDKIKVGG
jgi:hypothetical protein